MNQSAVAPALLCATIGLALAFDASWRLVAYAIVAALVAALLPVGSGFAAQATIGCWIGVVAAAVSMHLPRPPGHGIAAAVGVVAAFWAGLTVAASGRTLTIVAVAPWLLLGLPGAWLVATGRGVFVKVAASWLAAAALLSLGLGMVTTLGDAPDHRE